MIVFASGLDELVGRFDVALIDLWGVLHDGHTPYPGACDGLERLGAAGIVRILLSNSPRRHDPVIAQLEGIGIPRRLYDHVVTSGELTRRALAGRSGPDLCRYYYVGPARDAELLAGLPFERSADLGQADFLLVTGPNDDDAETEADYAQLLAAARRLNLSLICANPDLTVMRGARLITCAGALAAAYERLGGASEYFGKPHRPAYDACLALVPGVPRDRIVALGDSPRTDLAGAAANGIAGVLVACGLHAAELAAVRSADDPRLTSLLNGVPATALLRSFVW
jgi:HAD superfamily hydrolase (TIGR01459 family)